MANTQREITLVNSVLTANYMPRPRIDRIFDHITGCKLVYVIAGAGYGKTQAVYNYIIQQQDAVVRWLQLAESDNIGSHYWENLMHNITLDNPELASKLREFGFPETLARFKQFAEILKNNEHRSHKTFLILDDFHLIHSKQALTFAERCAHLEVPGACVIIISRKEPEINAVSLFAKGKAAIITEDELRFTENEIADFLKRRSIPFSAMDLPQFNDITKGWALAIKLLCLVLEKMPRNLERAAETMKQNIFKLFETEAFNDFSETTKKMIVRLSLLADLPVIPLREFFNDDMFAKNVSQLASFVWYDSFVGNYRVHPLYMEFLKSRQDILTDEDKQATYRWAAGWCWENKFYLAAVKYYSNSMQYDRVLEIFLSYPFKLPHDACDYFLGVLEGLSPEDGERGSRSVLLLEHLIVPLLYIGVGKHETARERSLDTIRLWENDKTPLGLYLLYTAYSNLSYIDTYACTVTHRYDFAEHLKKSVEYYKQTSEPPVQIEGPFGVPDVRSFACLVGDGADLGEVDLYLEKSREAAIYIAETYHCMYYGHSDLVACEIAFFKNRTEEARQYANSAILKAREKKQYSIEAMAEHYMLRMAIQDGDYTLAKKILDQLRSHLDNPDFWNRQLFYDLYTGFLYAKTGLADMMPHWLSMDMEGVAAEVRVPSRELIINVKYNVISKKYQQALAVLYKSYPREPHERFLFGELSLALLTAVALLKIGDAEGALSEFEKAYHMSFDGVFEMFFIELGKEMHPLAAAALASEDCAVPEEWIKAIDRKASIYAKKAAVIMTALRKERKIEGPIHLSEREQDVLNDMYHGLSREEIAENRYLSINTVKKILQSLYIKLDATNNLDAIRIAVEKKLVE